MLWRRPSGWIAILILVLGAGMCVTAFRLASTEAMRNLVVIYSLVLSLLVMIGGFMLQRIIRSESERARLACFPQRNPGPVYSLDSHARVTFSNAASLAMARELHGPDASVQDLLPRELPRKIPRLMARGATRDRIEYRRGERVLECDLQILPDLQLCHAYVADLTARRRAEKQLHFLATHDPATRLTNRSAFESSVGKVIDENPHIPGVLLLTEITRFGLFTANYGYTAGDRVLREFGQRLGRELAAIRGSERSALMCRFSGATFGIFVQGLPEGEQQATLFALLDACESDIQLDPAVFNCQLRCGGALFPQHGKDVETLIRHADAALATGKRIKNQTRVWYEESIGKSGQETLGLESSLRKALSDHEFHLLYQPKLSPDGCAVLGAEALLRWHSSDLGRVSPARFIPVAEQSGLIVKIGEWVLHHACQQMQAWCKTEAGGGEATQDRWPFVDQFRLSVNVSPLQFTMPGFLACVDEIVARSGVDPRRMELEITESALMDDMQRHLQVLNALAERGFGLSIDDFGTGYSSLAYLQSLPLTTLKIDKQFIDGITGNGKELAIARTVMQLAENLGLRVVAEGVETQQQLQLLAQYYCHEIQGYVFSKPLPPDDFLAYSRARGLTAQAS